MKAKHIEACEHVAAIEEAGPLNSSEKMTKALLLLWCPTRGVEAEDLPPILLKESRSPGTAAWQIVNEVIKENRDDYQVKYELIKRLEWWGNRRSDQLAFAEKLATELYEHDPSNQVWLEKLADLRIQLGEDRSYLQRLDEARNYFEGGVPLLEQLVERRPNDHDLKYDLAGAYRDYAWLLRKFPNRESVRGYFEKGIEILEEIMEEGYEARGLWVWQHMWLTSEVDTAEEKLAIYDKIKPYVDEWVREEPEMAGR